jgi:hypothetical protein
MGVLRSVFSRVAAQVGVGVVLGVLGAMVIAPLSDDAVLAGGLGCRSSWITRVNPVVASVPSYKSRPYSGARRPDGKARRVRILLYLSEDQRS